MKKIIILLVLGLAFLLRFYRLGSIPVSLYWDEVAIGYNSYSILSTGADEYGNKLPVLFRSFDDYKLPGYIYLTVPFIKVFGLNEFAVRALSATLGIFMVLFIFLIAKRFCGTKTGLLAALLLSVSPWHLQFTRAAYEASGGLFFLTLGMWLFFRKSFLFILALVASVYFYRSLQIVVPIALCLLLVLYGNKKLLIISLIGALLAIPVYWQTFFGVGQIRGDQVSIFNSSAVPKRKIEYVPVIIGGYLSHFSPQFLFLSGDPNNGRHGAEGFGQIYIWEMPFIILGILYFLRRRNKFSFLVLGLLMILPLPAALATPAPHALRSLNMVLPLIILSAAGGRILLKRWPTIVVGSIIVSVFIYKYLVSALEVTPINRANLWADGYKQLVKYVSINEYKYQKIIVSGHYWKPYVYFLFYKQYSPMVYQSIGTESSFGKYVFGGVSWGKNEIELVGQDLGKMVGGESALIILSPNEYQSQLGKVKEIDVIKNHKGDVIFKICEI